MSFLDALFARENVESAEQNRRLVGTPTTLTSDAHTEMQSRIRTFWGFPPILHYVDTHPRDGYPDTPLVPAGGRYMGVQALSLRDPDDARWLLDSHLTPIWLRAAASVRETNRIALSPQPAISPYSLEAWHVQSMHQHSNIGHGPGSVLAPLPQLGGLSQMAD